MPFKALRFKGLSAARWEIFITTDLLENRGALLERKTCRGIFHDQAIRRGVAQVLGNLPEAIWRRLALCNLITTYNILQAMTALFSNDLWINQELSITIQCAYHFLLNEKACVSAIAHLRCRERPQ